MSKYRIVKGTSFGEFICVAEFAGYDSDTGEEIYEDRFERSWNPHEENISEYDALEDATAAYDKIVEDFADNHHWPWNNPSFEGTECG